MLKFALYIMNIVKNAVAYLCYMENMLMLMKFMMIANPSIPLNSRVELDTATEEKN